MQYLAKIRAKIEARIKGFNFKKSITAMKNIIILDLIFIALLILAITGYILFQRERQVRDYQYEHSFFEANPKRVLFVNSKYASADKPQKYYIELVDNSVEPADKFVRKVSKRKYHSFNTGDSLVAYGLIGEYVVPTLDDEQTFWNKGMILTTSLLSVCVLLLYASYRMFKSG